MKSISKQCIIKIILRPKFILTTLLAFFLLSVPASAAWDPNDFGLLSDGGTVRSGSVGIQSIDGTPPSGGALTVNGTAATAFPALSPGVQTVANPSGYSGQVWSNLKYGNGVFVSVATSTVGTNRVMRSANGGASWSLVSDTDTNSRSWRALGFGENTFVTLQDVTGTTAPRGVYSTDGGGTWTPITVSSGDMGSQWSGIGYGEGKFIAVGRGGTGNRGAVSQDGVSWSQIANTTTASSPAWGAMWDVTYGEGKWVAVGQSGVILTSSDGGVTWTRQIVGGATASTWRGVAYGNGIFVAVASAGTNRLATSTDGVNWTPSTNLSTVSMIGISFGNGRFYIGDGGTTTSNNNLYIGVTGTTYATYNFTGSGNWQNFVYGGGDVAGVAWNGAGNRQATVSIGTTSSTTDSAFAISRTDYTATSSTLVRSEASLSSNSTCGTTWTNATTLEGSPPQSLSGGKCYKYTLTGSDADGDSEALATVVQARPSATLAQATSQSDPAELSSAVQFTLSSNTSLLASSVTSSDFTVTNGSIASIDPASGSASSFTINVTPLAGGTVSIAPSGTFSVQDSNSNTNISPSGSDRSVWVGPPINTSLPVISGTVAVGEELGASNGSWNGNPSSYAYQWQRCDATGDNCQNISGATAASYTLASADEGSTIRVRVQASNASGSAISTSNQTIVVDDATPPTLTLQQAGGQADPTNQSPVEFSFSSSEALQGSSVQAADFQLQSGTGTISVSGSGDTYIVSVASPSQGTITIAPSATFAVQDLAGNTQNSIAAGSDRSVVYDTEGPTASWQAPASPNKNSSFIYQLDFSENVTGVTAADITNTGNASGCSFAVSGSGSSYSVTVTSCSEGTVRPQFAAGGVEDAAGNSGPVLPASAPQILVDRTSPTASWQAPASPNKNSSFIYQLDFSENVTGVTAADITNTGNASGCSFAISGSGSSYSVTVTSCSEGTVRPQFAAGGAEDAAGNSGPVLPASAPQILVDRTAPTVTWQAPASPTRSVSLQFSLDFSEIITGLASTDIIAQGTATGCSLAVSGSGSSYTVEASSCSEGTLQLRLKPESIEDEAGNRGPAAAEDSASIVIDRTPPLLSLEQAADQSDPVSSGPVRFTLSSNKNLQSQTVQAADFGLLAGSGDISVSGSGSAYTIAVQSPGSGNITIEPSASFSVEDVAGNTQTTIAGGADRTVLVDTNPPTASWSDTPESPSNNTSLNYTLSFSENVSGLQGWDGSNNRDFSNAGTATGCQFVPSAATGETFTVIVTDCSEGTLQPRLAAGSVEDRAGNLGPASAAEAQAITIDRTPPSLSLEQAPGQPDPASSGPVRFELSSSSDLQSGTVEISDFQITEGTGTLAVSGSGSAYTVAVQSPSSGNITVGPSASFSVEDVAGNTQTTIAGGTDRTVLVDTSPPTAAWSDAPASPSNSATFAYTLSFSKGISGLQGWDGSSNRDFSNAGTATGCQFVPSSATGETFTVTVTECSEGTLRPRLAAGSVQDSIGNSGPATNEDALSITIDRSQPELSLTQAPGQDDPTNEEPIRFAFTSDKELQDASVQASDFQLQSGSGTISLSGSGSLYTISVAPGSSGTFTIAPSPTFAVTDRAGNTEESITGGIDRTVVFDITAPSASWKETPPSPNSGTSPTYTLSFSENVSGLQGWDGSNNRDFSNAGTATGCQFVPSAATGETFTVIVTDCSEGTLQPRLAAGSVEDSLGNSGPLSAQSGATVVIDRTAPTTTWTSPESPNNSNSLSFTLTFSENVTGVAAEDITEEGAASGCSLVVSGSGSVYTVAASDCSDGTLQLRFAAEGATDLAGNKGPLAVAISSPVIIDLAPPVLSLEKAAGQSDPANSAPILFRFTSSKTIAFATITKADFQITNGSLSAADWISPTSNSSSYTLRVTPAAQGLIEINPATEFSVADLAGNTAGEIVGGTDRSVRYDSVAPTASWSNLPDSPSRESSFSYQLNFSEPVTGVQSDDFVNAGTATECSFDPGEDIGDSRTVSISGCSQGTLRPRFAAEGALDGAGNLGPSSPAEAPSALLIDNAPPELVLKQAENQEDPTDQKAVYFTLSANETLDYQTITESDFRLENGEWVTISPTENSDSYTITTKCTDVANLSISPSTTFSVKDLLGNEQTVAGGNDRSVSCENIDPDSIENIVPPVVTGGIQVGDTLSATTGIWESTENLQYAYQWQRTFGADGIWQNIPYAQDSSYEIPSDYPGYRIRVRIKAYIDNRVTYAWSAATAAVQKIPVNTATPMLEGRSQVGQELQASPGSWSAWPEPSYSYQWQRKTSSWQDITGAITSSYTVQEADRGYSLRVRVRATNTIGGAQEQTDAWSAPLGISDITVRRGNPFTYALSFEDRNTVSDLSPGDIRNSTDSVTVPSGSLAEALSGCSYQFPEGYSENTAISSGASVNVSVYCPGNFGAFRPELRASAVRDLAGNTGAASATLGDPVVIDRQAPTPQWPNPPSSPTSERPFTYYIAWEDAYELSGLESTDFVNTAQTIQNSVSPIEPLQGCTFFVPAQYRGAYKINPGQRVPLSVDCPGNLGVFQPLVSEGAVLDEAGNPSLEGSGPPVIVDRIAPEVSWQRVSSSPRLETDFQYELLLEDHGAIFDLDPQDIDFRGNLPGLSRCRITSEIPTSGSSGDQIAISFSCPRPATGVYNFWPVLRSGSVEDASGNRGPLQDAVGPETVFDYEAPQGAELVVNGVAATVPGTSSYSSTGTFSLSRVDAVDISEPVENIVSLQFSDLQGNTCSAEWTDAVYTDTSSQEISQSGCWRYILTSSDVLGNSASIRTTVRVDLDPPEVGLRLENATGSTWIDGLQVYYAALPGRNGSFRAVSEATDEATGIQSVLFPILPDFLSGGGTDFDPPYQTEYSWSGESPNAFGQRPVRATDLAGGFTEESFELIRDTGAPTVSWGSCQAEEGPEPLNEWFRSAARCSFEASDTISGPDTMSVEVSYNGGTTWQPLSPSWSGESQGGIREGTVVISQDGDDILLRGRAVDRVGIESPWTERTESIRIDKVQPEDKTEIASAYHKSFRLLPATVDGVVEPGVLNIDDATSGWDRDATRCWVRPLGSSGEGTELADCSSAISSSQEVRYRVFDRAGWSVNSPWQDIKIENSKINLQVTGNSNWSQGTSLQLTATVEPEEGEEAPPGGWSLGIDSIQATDVNYGEEIATSEQLPDLQDYQTKNAKTGCDNQTSCTLTIDLRNEAQRIVSFRALGEVDDLGQAGASADVPKLVQIDLSSPTFESSDGTRSFPEARVWSSRAGAWRPSSVWQNSGTLVDKAGSMVNVQVDLRDPPLVLQLPGNPTQTASNPETAKLYWCKYGNRFCRKGLIQGAWTDLSYTPSGDKSNIFADNRFEGQMPCTNMTITDKNKINCAFDASNIFPEPGAWIIATSIQDRAGNKAFLPQVQSETDPLPPRTDPDYIRGVTRSSFNPFCPID